MSEEREYKVASPLKHDGERYKVGAVLAMAAALAEPLVANGTLVDPDPDVETEPETPAETLEERLVEAIEALNPEDQTHWTKGGKPDATVLAEKVGEKVTSQQRDAAWDLYQERQTPAQ